MVRGSPGRLELEDSELKIYRKFLVELGGTTASCLVARTFKTFSPSC